MLEEKDISNLSVFVISSSQLGAEAKDAANSVELMSGPRIQHYWDGEQRVGAAVQQFVEGADEPAWDFWMLYAPGVTWEKEGAPEPDWWEHQLGGVLEQNYANRILDAERFADQAEKLSRLTEAAN